MSHEMLRIELFALMTVAGPTVSWNASLHGVFLRPTQPCQNRHFSVKLAVTSQCFVRLICFSKYKVRLFEKFESLKYCDAAFLCVASNHKWWECGAADRAVRVKFAAPVFLLEVSPSCSQRFPTVQNRAYNVESASPFAD